MKEPPILTQVRVIPASVHPDPELLSCIRGRLRLRSRGAAVGRIGVSGESITFTDVARAGLYACDNSRGRREGDRRWCGTSFGRLHAGHLVDPRVDILCATERGSPLGFLWIEPSQDARYIVVQQRGYAEAYEVAAGLPVRISTETGVSSDPAEVVVELSEHDAAGKLLERVRLRAAPAG